MADLSDQLRKAGWTISEDGRYATSPWFDAGPPPAPKAGGASDLRRENETLRARVAYLERELANLKTYAASLAQLLSQRDA